MSWAVCGRGLQREQLVAIDDDFGDFMDAPTSPIPERRRVSAGQDAAVDRQGDAGDVAACVAGQEHDCAVQLAGGAESAEARSRHDRSR